MVYHTPPRETEAKLKSNRDEYCLDKERDDRGEGDRPFIATELLPVYVIRGFKDKDREERVKEKLRSEVDGANKLQRRNLRGKKEDNTNRHQKNSVRNPNTFCKNADARGAQKHEDKGKNAFYHGNIVTRMRRKVYSSFYRKSNSGADCDYLIKNTAQSSFEWCVF